MGIDARIHIDTKKKFGYTFVDQNIYKQSEKLLSVCVLFFLNKNWTGNKKNRVIFSECFCFHTSIMNLFLIR